MPQFRKAIKTQARLRLALFGPSGSGKTYTALRIATGLGGAIAVIDTERCSASKYADRFVFDVLDLEIRTIESYVEAIDAAKTYDVLIVDSLSHAWQQMLVEINAIARANHDNTWAAWSKGTPKQRMLIDAILAFPGHVIATMRSKTEWATERDERSGKNKPVRIGLAPEQGKGIEYEFDMLMELSPEHVASVTKDRTGRYQDKSIDKPGEDLGKALAAWLADAPEPAHWIEDPEGRRRFWAWAKGDLHLSEEEVHQALGAKSVKEFAGDKSAAVKLLKAFAEGKGPMGDGGSRPGDAQAS